MKNATLMFLLCLTFGIDAQVQKFNIGFTYYDLQTNNSIGRRIVNDGTNVIMTYTGSNTNDQGSGGFADRGTGYVIYDGTTFKDGSGNALTLPVTAFPGRIEGNTRVGWPEPLILKNGKEAVITHESSSGSNGLHIASRGTLGSGAWTLGKLTQGPETWPRSANNGDTIVVVSSVFESEFNGITGGIGIVKSIDGGSTWTPNIMGVNTIEPIDGIDAVNFPNGLGGDCYAIDLKGNTIAVLVGVSDIVLFKSTDFGATWTKNILSKFNGDDTLNVNDHVSSGDMSVIIDNNGKIHCFWAKRSTLGSAYTLPYRFGISYWNETLTKPIHISKTEKYRDQNPNSLDISLAYSVIQYTTGGSIPQNYNQGQLVNFPSSGVDASNNIYLSYTSLVGMQDTNRYKDQKLNDAKGNFMSEILLLKSTDGGNSWIGPINISQNDSMENAYASMAKKVDGFVHLVYQEDPLYGSVIGTTSTEISNTNNIVYAKVPVNDIVDLADNSSPQMYFSDLNHNSNLDLSFQTTQDFFDYIQDTLVFYKGCNVEKKSKKVYPNLDKFLSDSLVTVSDNSGANSASMLTVSKSNTASINTVGFSTYTFTAKDAANNSSLFQIKPYSNGYQIQSLDTIIKYVSVLDLQNAQPIIDLGGIDTIISYVGDVVNDPGNVTASVESPCEADPIVSTSSDCDKDVVSLCKIEYSVNYSGGKVTKDRTVMIGENPNPKFEDLDTASKLITATNTTGKVLNQANTYIWGYKDSKGKFQKFSKNSGTNGNLKYSYTSSFNANAICLVATNRFTSTTHKADTTCENFKISSGIEASSNENITITLKPNPSIGEFFLNITGVAPNINAEIKIYSEEGKLVYESNKVQSFEDKFIDLKHLADGKYFVNTIINNQKIINPILIVK